MANNVNETKATATAEKKQSIGEMIDKGYGVFLGLHEKAGDFENEKGEKIEFHNILVTLAFPIEEDNNSVNYYGADCVQYKIKAEDVLKVFCYPKGADWYSCFNASDWLYKPVEVVYKRKTDSRGNLVLSKIRRVDSLE